MTLKAKEFIRRFTMHILPDRFVKIRHYGILGNRNKKLKFKRCLEIFRVKPRDDEKLSSAELFTTLKNIKVNIGLIMGRGKLYAKIRKYMRKRYYLIGSFTENY